MAIALFDLDNTLLDGDSDYAWGQFLVELGVVDGEAYERANQRFYDDYKAGRLDIYEFSRFAYRPLRDNPLPRLLAWRERFMAEKVAPMMQARGRARIDWHRERGDQVVIITATNRFVTTPIAAAFGADQLLATEPEFVDGAYTGEIAGIPCFQEGKVERLRLWMNGNGNEAGLAGSWFYSDSHNDLPLLEQVTHPVAVDPDDALRKTAHERGWELTSFRD